MRRTNLIKSLALVTALMLVTTACGKEKLIGETNTPNTTTVLVEEKTVHQTPPPTVISVSTTDEADAIFDNPELIGVDLSVDFYGNEELTYMPYEKTLYCHKALNVRDMPNTSGNKVGSIKVGEEVHVIGIDKETGWYLLENGNYCSNEAQYLKAEKYVKPTTSTPTTPTTPTTPSTPTMPDWAVGTVQIGETTLYVAEDGQMYYDKNMRVRYRENKGEYKEGGTW